MKNKLKALLRLDLTMWSVLIIVIVCITSIIYVQIVHEQKETAEKSNRIHQISQHAKSILATNPDFKIPEVNTSSYIKNGHRAEKVSITKYHLNGDFNKATYTIKNNYKHDVFITPELTNMVFNEPQGIAVELLFYDFDQAYKIIKPGEEINLDFTITIVERSKLNRKNFKAYRLIYKNDEKRTVIGYIKIGEGNE
jgi:hypothetical protein